MLNYRRLKQELDLKHSIEGAPVDSNRWLFLPSKQSPPHTHTFFFLFYCSINDSQAAELKRLDWFASPHPHSQLVPLLPIFHQLMGMMELARQYFPISWRSYLLTVGSLVLEVFLLRITF